MASKGKEDFYTIEIVRLRDGEDEWGLELLINNKMKHQKVVSSWKEIECIFNNPIKEWLNDF